MKKIIYTTVLIFALFHFYSCENELVKAPNFSVTTQSQTYEVGEDVVFLIENAADWMVFYSGEENKEYPESTPMAIKSITNSMTKFSYQYKKPGTYECVFVGGSTNYKTDKQQTFKMTVSIKENIE